MEPLDVVLAAVPVGESTDKRWCVIVDVLPDSRLVVVPCSAQMDLFRDGRDFMIRSSHPDYDEAVFTKECYAIHDLLVVIPPESVRRVRGRLRGQLAKEFADWAGIPFPGDLE